MRSTFSNSNQNICTPVGNKRLHISSDRDLHEKLLYLSITNARAEQALSPINALLDIQLIGQLLA